MTTIMDNAIHMWQYKVKQIVKGYAKKDQQVDGILGILDIEFTLSDVRPHHPFPNLLMCNT